MIDDILRVNLLAVSPHNKAILEFFFAGAGKRLFHLYPTPEYAQVLILDYDFPSARETWEHQHRNDPRLCLVLSMHEAELPHSIWLPKPLTSKALTEAATKAHHLLKELPHLNRPLPPTTPESNKINSTPRTIEQPTIQLRTAAVIPFTPASELPQPSIPLHSQNQITPTLNVVTPAHSSSPSPRHKNLLVSSTPAALNQPRVLVDPVLRQQRWTLLCGTSPDVQPHQLLAAERVFNPEHYLFEKLLQAVQQAQKQNCVTQLVLSTQHYLLFMPQSHQVFSTLDIYSSEFANFFSTPFQYVQSIIHIPTAEELTKLEALAQHYSTHLYNLDTCIWTASLLTAQGRLSQTSDPNRSYQLRHWPNLTRLESLPNVMSIAAMWTQQAANPFEIAEQLHIPQRHVFAFHTAASALDLLSQSSTVPSSRPKSEPKKNRGLFSRLLKRLLGGG